MKFNEQVTIENHIIKFLKEKLEYEYIKPQEFAKLREFENEYVITQFLLNTVKKINDIDDTQAQAVVREVKKADTNEDFFDILRNGVNLKDLETGKMRDYKVVDYDNLENNHFVATNQFYFEGDIENIRTDVMVFLNGLSVALIEAKSPTASESVSFENGIEQIGRYEKVARKLFLPNCFNVATDGLKTVYGATGAPKQYFFEWKDEDMEKELGGNLEMSLSSLLEKGQFLDIIKNFILFEKTKNGAIKKIARYQQLRATNKIVERVKLGKTKRGLVWHTQGSGKSLTMFFTAWKLRFEKSLDNPKVFILVDRIDLDDQLYETFINSGGENVVRVISRKDLEKKINSPERGIFISTIQKFSELGEQINNLDKNVIVLSDEAHRDNEGISAINLRNAMKHAFFFGFTGTPIDKLTLNTHRNFGEEGERYLDYYSIQQAIDDGATLPVTYEARLSKFSIDDEKIDEQFDDIAGDLDDKKKNELVKKYGKKAALVKLDKRMRAVAQDIVEHYKLYVEPNGFKAQIVCYDRDATAKYKEILDSLVPASWSAVVYSPGDRNSDTDDLKKYNTNKAERERIIEKFKNPSNPLRFLLVCDMLLTGFDAPIEQVMYLDKPLRDHNLLQAIARTNRVYPNKGTGKIIDYYGITKNLYDSLDFDESIVDSAMIDFERIKDEFISALDKTLDIFGDVNIENPSIENLRRCLKIFIDNKEKQKYFSEKYARLKMLFEILSPDPFLKKYIRKFEWITSFYLAFVKEFQSESDAYLLEQYGEKMKKMIQESNAVDFEGITKSFRQLRVDELYTLERLNKMDDEEKALNLEKMLKQEISVDLDTNPAFVKFSERLTAIRREFEQNQIDLSERIKRYQELLENIKDKRGEAKELGFNLKEYALYVISEEFVKGEDVVIREFIRETTFRLESVLDNGWQDSSKRDIFLKNVKRELQEILLKEYKDKIEISDFHKYMNRLVDIVIKKF